MTIAESLAAATLAFLFLSFLKRFVHKRYSFKPKETSYAVVTGASDGIGKEFALQLAKKGYNVVVMARSKDKLNQVAQEIQKLGQKSLVIPFDFSTTDYDILNEKLQDLDIEVLINNVGVSHEFPVSFLEEDPKVIERIMNVNCNAMMKMTRLVVPRMVVNRKGLVLNIGSFAGKVPSGLLAVYGASKAWVKSFSQGLAMELKSKNVHVEHINTYFVQTAMSKIRKSSMTVPTPKEYVKSVLNNCGGSCSSTPYWSHTIIDWLTDFVPESLLINATYNLHVDIRKRALRKRERELKSQ